MQMLVFRRKERCDAKHGAPVRNCVSKNSVLPQNVIQMGGRVKQNSILLLGRGD